MIDKYIHLSLDSALEVLNQWSLASTKLRLTAASALVGLSFSASAQVAKDPTALSVRFTWDAGGEVGVSLFDANGLRASAEEPRRWLVFSKPGDLRFVLEVEDGGEIFDDLALASMLEN